ncbi:MAG: hypothetical protein A2Z29_03730 [Chloroflexi bacterium RBG_16_56_11]|nr:MAG: hypothetical protein A2Z29_03730 [Chloroflexi bacterium RBG_16_56_11]
MTNSTDRRRLSPPIRHSLIMVLCCLIPLAVLAVLWAVGVSKNYLTLGLLLLCPLLHVVLMKDMFKSRDNREDHYH